MKGTRSDVSFEACFCSFKASFRGICFALEIWSGLHMDASPAHLLRMEERHTLLLTQEKQDKDKTPYSL